MLPRLHARRQPSPKPSQCPPTRPSLPTSATTQRAQSRQSENRRVQHKRRVAKKRDAVAKAPAPLLQLLPPCWRRSEPAQQSVSPFSSVLLAAPDHTGPNKGS